MQFRMYIHAGRNCILQKYIISDLGYRNNGLVVLVLLLGKCIYISAFECKIEMAYIFILNYTKTLHV